MQVKDSLTNAENNLKDFREQNRMINQSPMLLLEQGRLMRQVEILQTVYIELTKQLELTKIDEVRDTPVLNIKEMIKGLILKTGRKRMSALIIIMFLSLLQSAVYLMYSSQIKV